MALTPGQDHERVSALRALDRELAESERRELLEALERTEDEDDIDIEGVVGGLTMLLRALSRRTK